MEPLHVGLREAWYIVTLCMWTLQQRHHPRWCSVMWFTWLIHITSLHLCPLLFTSADRRLRPQQSHSLTVWWLTA